MGAYVSEVRIVVMLPGPLPAVGETGAHGQVVQLLGGAALAQTTDDHAPRISGLAGW